MVRSWILGAALTVALAAAVRADTLVTKDGRRFTGEVTHIDGGYTVKTKMGAVVVIDDYNCEAIFKEGAAAPATATAPTAPAIVHPAAPTTTDIAATGPASRPADPKTIQALLQQGENALAAGEYAAAREAFGDAAALDSHNVTALHGEALACLYQNDFVHAREPMDRALSARAAPNRPLIINSAVVQIGLRNAMRAVKIIRDYMTSRPNDLDEPMLNALAVAMSIADDQAKKQKFFTDAEAFYASANAKVEAQVPGQKRWGIQWMAADVVDQKMTDYRAALKKANLLAQEAEDLTSRVAACQQEVERAMAAPHHGNFEVLRAQERLQTAKGDRDRKNEALQQARAAVHGPDFPHTMTPVGLDDLTPPPVTGTSPTALALGRTPETSSPEDASHNPSKHSHPKPGSEPPAPLDSHSSPAATTREAPPEPPIEVIARPVTKRKVQITSYAAAFPVAADLVVTTAGALEGTIDVELQASDGMPVKGTVVRSDPSLGLALVRLSGRTVRPLPLGGDFEGGNIHIAGFPTPNIFNPSPEMMLGSLAAAADGGKLKLARNPRLAGAPILAGGRVVGVEMTTRDADLSQVPFVSLEQLLKFVGGDAARDAAAVADPLTVVFQLTATRESRE